MNAPTIGTIGLSGFLSFGPTRRPVGLGALTVLIGPNGSGKSNLIEALDVLGAVSRDLPLPIRKGGGVKEWLWKGLNSEEVHHAELDIVLPEGVVAVPAVRYRLRFGAEGDRFVVLDERIENEFAVAEHPRPYFYFGYENGKPTLNQREGGQRALRREDIDPTQSILTQRRDPELYPELARLYDVLRSVVVYRRWTFGPESLMRESCGADAPSHRLEPDLSNLPVRLQALKGQPAVKRRLLRLVGEIAEGFTDIEVIPEGGRMQLYLTEGDRNFAARRLSDGTLRMLCLGAILLDPPPGAIIVIDEPELGLHPDLMPVVRDLLLEASQRAQIIVTTHSTVLADAFTDHADCVRVVEKRDGLTEVRALNQGDVDRWKADGGLGRLWMSGQLGGTRW